MDLFALQKQQMINMEIEMKIINDEDKKNSCENVGFEVYFIPGSEKCISASICISTTPNEMVREIIEKYRNKSGIEIQRKNLYSMLKI